MSSHMENLYVQRVEKDHEAYVLVCDACGASEPLENPPSMNNIFSVAFAHVSVTQR